MLERVPSGPLTERQPLAPWGLGTGLTASVVSLLVFYIGGSGLLVALHPKGALRTLEVGILSYQFLLLGVALSAVVLILIRFPHSLQALGFQFPGWPALLTAAATVLPIYAGVAILYWLFNTLLPAYHLHSNIHDVFGKSPPHVGLLEQAAIFLWAAVEAPLVEETLFRGMLFQGLHHFFARWLSLPLALFIGALLSGLVFALVHFEPHTFPILWFLGVVLAYVFFYTRSLYSSAVVHGIINAISIATFFHGT